MSQNNKKNTKRTMNKEKVIKGDKHNEAYEAKGRTGPIYLGPPVLVTDDQEPTEVRIRGQQDPLDETKVEAVTYAMAAFDINDEFNSEAYYTSLSKDINYGLNPPCLDLSSEFKIQLTSSFLKAGEATVESPDFKLTIRVMNPTEYAKSKNIPVRQFRLSNKVIFWGKVIKLDITGKLSIDTMIGTSFHISTNEADLKIQMPVGDNQDAPFRIGRAMHQRVFRLEEIKNTRYSQMSEDMRQFINDSLINFLFKDIFITGELYEGHMRYYHLFVGFNSKIIDHPIHSYHRGIKGDGVPALKDLLIQQFYQSSGSFVLEDDAGSLLGVRIIKSKNGTSDSQDNSNK